MAKVNETPLTDEQVELLIKEYRKQIKETGKANLRKIALVVGVTTSSVWHYTEKYEWLLKNWRF